MNDEASIIFTPTNATTEPYILVNQTNVQQWYYKPFAPWGSVYGLQWYISWNSDIHECDSDPLGLFGTLFFNINSDSPEPNLSNLTGQCPQLGAVYEMDTAFKNSTCSVLVTNNGTGNPCAVTLNQDTLGNISSTWQSIVAASKAAASASAASATRPLFPSSTIAHHNAAVGLSVPLSYSLMGAFLASLPMLMSL